MVRSDGKAGFWILVVLVIVVLMIATNPSREAHKAKAYEHMQQQAEKDGFWAGIGAGVAEAADLLEVAGLEYRNYRLASVLVHDDDILAVGIFGMVFVIEE